MDVAGVHLGDAGGVDLGVNEGDVGIDGDDLALSDDGEVDGEVDGQVDGDVGEAGKLTLRGGGGGEAEEGRASNERSDLHDESKE